MKNQWVTTQILGLSSETEFLKRSYLPLITFIHALGHELRADQVMFWPKLIICFWQRNRRGVCIGRFLIASMRHLRNSS